MMVDASSKQQRHQHITSQRGDGATANAHTYPPTYIPTYLPTYLPAPLSLSLSLFFVDFPIQINIITLCFIKAASLSHYFVFRNIL